MSKPDYQFEYVQGQGRPYYPQLLQDFGQWSEAAAVQGMAQLDVAYGAHPRQRLDVFPCAVEQAQGVLLYLHAGYWQSRDKSLFHWLAPHFNRRGLHVVLANYPLCPEVSLAQLINMLEPAVNAAHSAKPGWQNRPLVLAGHSAGGHLTCELGMQHAAYPQALGRVDGLWAMSGIYDLPPLCGTTLNERLQLSVEQAQSLSPMQRALPLDLPAVWVVGAEETAEFLRQNRQMHEAWAAQGNWSACAEVAGADHFSLLQNWAALDHGLQAHWDAWWPQVVQRHAERGAGGLPA